MAEPLIDAFQRATRLKIEYEMTPRWRWRRRARLFAKFDEALRAADRARATLGASPDAPGLGEVLTAASRTDGSMVSGAGGIEDGPESERQDLSPAGSTTPAPAAGSRTIQEEPK